MVQNSATILRKSPLILRSTILSSLKPSQRKISILPLTPLHLTTPTPFSPPCLIHSHIQIPNFHCNKLLGPFVSRFRQMGHGYSRVSAVSGDGNGGSGGSPGGGGGGGGESGGSGDNGRDNSKWNLISWYQELLAKYPVLTKAVTSAMLTFIGDLICQLVIDKVPSLDYKRNFIFTFLGLVLVGPTLHFWYLYLSKLVTLPGASGAFVRLLLDQFLFAPAFIGVFLSALVTLEGRPSEVVPKLQQEWFSSVLANWKLWIPFQFLNFRFVPQQLQVLASNFVALIWNVILSYKAHKVVVTK